MLTSSMMKRVTKSVVGQTRFMSGSQELIKTAFYDMHLELGGKMVPFAGYVAAACMHTKDLTQTMCIYEAVGVGHNATILSI